MGEGARTCSTTEIAALQRELANARRARQATLKALEARTGELNDALEQQQAAAMTLKTLSNSAFDLDAMLNALVDSSMALCGAGTGGIVIRINGEYRMRANKGETPEFEKLRTTYVYLPGRLSIVERVLRSGMSEMIVDVKEDPDFAWKDLTYNRSLIGVPLLRDGEIIGVFVLSKQKPGGFTERQIQLLKTFADQAVIAIGTVRLLKDLEQRTAELDQSLQDLRNTQDRLIQSEKLASRAERLKSLGMMIAGVAHEINTPLGVAITAASHVEEETRKIREALENQKMTPQMLDDYLNDSSEGSRLLMGNLTRAGALVASFKRVSVDEVSGDHRQFCLGDVLHDAAAILEPQLRVLGHRLNVDCPDDLILTSYPAAFVQIITNFVLNSTIHAFPDGRVGTLRVSASQIEGSVDLRYWDDGAGVSADVLRRIFDYFFTTRRGQGGSGLGLGIVHNLVTQQLGGEIEAINPPGKGLEFRILAPLSVPLAEQPPR